MASAAEGRIRTKAEALLREHFPSARIIHEFDLGGVRLDLAAVTENRLALVEIKSELDTLSRLDRQLKFATAYGGPVLVCHAPRWVEPIRTIQRSGGLYGVEWLTETDEGFSGLYPMRLNENHDRYNSRLLLSLLLKSELLALARPFGGKTKHTVPDLHSLAHENLTGRTIRRGVMAALRARRFGWVCDEPFPAESSVLSPSEASAGNPATDEPNV
jgi:hypothetical protein